MGDREYTKQERIDALMYAIIGGACLDATHTMRPGYIIEHTPRGSVRSFGN